MNFKAFGVGLVIGSMIFLVALSFITKLSETNFIAAAAIMTIGIGIMFYGYARGVSTEQKDWKPPCFGTKKVLTYGGCCDCTYQIKCRDEYDEAKQK